MTDRLNKVIILVGPSCAGKDTLLEYLVKEYGYFRIPSYSTRPMRPYEEQGKPYRFITKEEFESEDVRGIWCEKTCYDMVKGRVFYGTRFCDYMTGEDSVIVLNPEGCDQVQRQIANTFTIWLDIPEDVRLDRMAKRGDEPREALRRLKRDTIDFKRFEKHGKWDLRVGTEAEVEELATFIVQYIDAVGKTPAGDDRNLQGNLWVVDGIVEGSR